LIDAVSVLVHELNDRHNLSYYGRFIGHVHPKLKWRTVHLAADINEFTDQDAAFAGAVLDCK